MSFWAVYREKKNEISLYVVGGGRDRICYIFLVIHFQYFSLKSYYYFIRLICAYLFLPASIDLHIETEDNSTVISKMNALDFYSPEKKKN